MVRCIEAGAEDYLPKPFNPVLLRARINACLERKRWRDRERRLPRASSRPRRSAPRRCCTTSCRGPIVARLNDGEVVIADRFDEVDDPVLPTWSASPSCAAAHAAGAAGRAAEPALLRFRPLARELGIEKIKTIGDAYMAAAGLPRAARGPRRGDGGAGARHAGRAGAAERDRAASRSRSASGCTRARSWPASSARHKFIYDVWGDTVNMASRLEAQGVPGRIQVSAATRDALADRYAFEPRGPVEISGKGRMPAYLLLGRHSSLAEL